MRLVFNRKNKTLRSVLCTKTVFDLLQSNLTTYCALNSLVSPRVSADVCVCVSLGCGPHDITCLRSRFSRVLSGRQPVPDPMPDMKETIEAVLDSCGMSGKRANKLTQDDLLA